MCEDNGAERQEERKMNKQELIDALKAKKNLLFAQHQVAYKKWKDYQSKYGTADFLTCLASEEMSALSARLDEIFGFIEMLRTLED